MRIRAKNVQAGRMEDWSTNDFLDALMRRYGLTTDYQLHKLLKVSRQTIYRYRDKAGATFEDSIALRVAELLEIDPQKMLVWCARQRASCTQAIEHWKTLQNKLAHAAIFLLCLGVTWHFGWDLGALAQASFWTVGYTHYAQWPAVFALLLILRIFRDRS